MGNDLKKLEGRFVYARGTFGGRNVLIHEGKFYSVQCITALSPERKSSIGYGLILKQVVGVHSMHSVRDLSEIEKIVQEAAKKKKQEINLRIPFIIQDQ